MAHALEAALAHHRHGDALRAGDLVLVPRDADVGVLGWWWVYDSRVSELDDQRDLRERGQTRSRWWATIDEIASRPPRPVDEVDVDDGTSGSAIE